MLIKLASADEYELLQEFQIKQVILNFTTLHLILTANTYEQLASATKIALCMTILIRVKMLTRRQLLYHSGDWSSR